MTQSPSVPADRAGNPSLGLGDPSGSSRPHCQALSGGSFARGAKIVRAKFYLDCKLNVGYCGIIANLY